MYKGKTESGFEFEVMDSAANNMELIDALADADDGNPLAVSKALKILIGPAQRKELYKLHRNESGIVPADIIAKELLEILQSMGEDGKN